MISLLLVGHSQFNLRVWIHRTSLSGGVRYGSHRSRRNVFGDSGKRWGAFSSWETQHPQAARWGFLLGEDLQAEWVSELNCRRPLQHQTFIHSLSLKPSIVPLFRCSVVWKHVIVSFQWLGLQCCWDHVRCQRTNKWAAADCTEVSVSLWKQFSGC